MNCVKPVVIRHPKEEERAKGSPYNQMTVPCGKCLACTINRKREWKIRLLRELEDWKQSSFITLTYNNETLPIGETLIKKDLQDYLKRLRYYLGDNKIKYYAVGEYGDNYYRPHYHAIIFGSNDKELIEKSWNKGFVYVGNVTHDSIQYVTGYITKKLWGQFGKDVYGDRLPPFNLMSQGLGKSYALRNADRLKRDLTEKMKGKPVGLPRYFAKVLEIKDEDLKNKRLELIEKVYERRYKYLTNNEREAKDHIDDSRLDIELRLFYLDEIYLRVNREANKKWLDEMKFKRENWSKKNKL